MSNLSISHAQGIDVSKLSPEEYAIVREIRTHKLINVDGYTPGKRGYFGFYLDSILGWGGKQDRIRESSLRANLASVFSMPALKGLFEPQEQRQLVDQALTNVKDELGLTFCQDCGLRVLHEIAQTVFVPVADRLLKSKGVTSPIARQAWADRFIGHFRDCVGRSSNMLEADRCIDSLNASISQNVGFAILHEMVRSEVAPALGEAGPSGDSKRLEVLRDADRDYLRCVGNQPLPGGADDVEKCVFKSIREAILKVSGQVMRAKLNDKLGPQDSVTVQNQVWGPFETCIERANAASSLRACIDELVVRAGERTVEFRVAHEPAVAPAVPESNRRLAYAREQAESFRKCMTDRVQMESLYLATKKPVPPGIRNAQGMLETSPCSDRIENSVTLLVATSDFKETVLKNLGSDDPSANAVIERSQSALRRCWVPTMVAQKRAQCIREGVIALAEGIAGRLMEAKVPADLIASDPKFRSGNLARFSACLNRELPADVANAPARDKQLSRCTAELIRAVATPIAEHKVRDALKARMSASELNSLIASKVHQEFAGCLGEAPSSLVLDTCTVQLVKDVSKKAAQLAIPAEVEGYVKNSASRLSEQDRRLLDSKVAGVVSSIDVCLDSLKPAQARKADVIADRCFKNGINDLVVALATLQFDRETRSIYRERPAQQAALQSGFISRLKKCAEMSSSNPRVNLNDHVTAIYACVDAESIRVTREIGHDQIQNAANTFLKDDNVYSFSRDRERIFDQILPAFDQCLTKIRKDKVSTDRSRCIEQMQRDTSEAVVLAIGRSQQQVQLGAKPRPEAIAVERKFSACVKSARAEALSEQLDDCTRSYILSLTKEVARIKVSETLKEAFGTKEYAASRNRITSQLSAFSVCLDRLQTTPVGVSLMNGVNQCAANLQDEARELIRSRLHAWMHAGELDGSPGTLAKRLLVEQLPCMDALIPSKEETAVVSTLESDVNRSLGGDVEGTLQGLALLFKDYIEFDAKKADIDVERTLKSIAQDLQTVSRQEARARLVQNLDQSGMMDQLIKSVIRSNVAQSLDALPQDQRFSAEVRARLLQTDIFDELLKTPEGRRIRSDVVERLVKPVLLDGASLSDPRLSVAKTSIKSRVVTQLAEMPSFGDVLIHVSIQKEMNDLNPAARLLARMFYGADSLKWSKTRLTAAGQEAEQYIREQILKPKMGVQDLPSDEEARRMERAKELVTKAVKS